MPGGTNKVKVEIIGDSKNASKDLKRFGQDLSTLHGRLNLFGKALKDTFTGHFGKANKEFGALSKAGKITGGMFGFLTRTAAAAGAALPYVGAAAVGLIGALTGVYLGVNSCISAFATWAGAAATMSRITGMSTAASSDLLANFRLLDVDSSKASTSIAMLTKNLGGAQLGVKANVSAFKLLHINVKGLTAASALPMVASRLGQITSASERGYIASKLFGRSWKDLSRYLLQSKSSLAANTKFVKSLGLEMGPKSQKIFLAYQHAQAKMSLAWDAIKIHAGAALAPIATKYLAAISGWVASHMKKINTDFSTWATVVGKNLEPAMDAVGKYSGIIIGWLADPANQKKVQNFFSDACQAAGIFASLLSGIMSTLDAIGNAYKWLTSPGGGGTGDLKSTLANYHGGGGGGGTARRHALGGVFSSPHIGLIGESGPEAIIPLSRPARAAQVMAEAGLSSAVNIYLDGNLIARHMAVHQRDASRRAARTFGLAPV